MVEPTPQRMIASSPITSATPLLGALSLVSGAMAVALALLDLGSWIFLGAAMVPWILCGRALYVVPTACSRVTRLMADIMWWSAAAAALAVLTALYLLALGPSWVL